MNAITKSLTKVDAEVARIVEKLDQLDNIYDISKGGYRNDQFTRQGARSLASKLLHVSNSYAMLANDEDGSLIPYATETLNEIAAKWNDREDWRTGAFKANVAKAVERLVGLS